MRHAVVLPLLLAAIGVSVPVASAQDGRAAVEAFVARFSNVQIGDVVIDQNLSLYYPDGQRPYLSGEQRMFFKVPQRQRVEQTLDGQREIQITALVAEGLTNREIADQLRLSVGTVRTSMTGILGKLDLRRRTQLAVWAASQSTQQVS